MTHTTERETEPNAPPVAPRPRYLDRAHLNAALLVLLSLGAIAAKSVEFAVWVMLVPLEVLLVDFCATAIHEFGHIIAGRVVGYRTDVIRIGPITVEATGRGYRLQRFGAPFLGGHVSGELVGVRWAVWREIVLCLGGPVASALLALFAFGAILIIPFDFSTHWHLWLIVAISVRHLYLSLTTPQQEEFWPDGSRIVYLLRYQHHAERWRKFIALCEAAGQNTRPRDWAFKYVDLLMDSRNWSRMLHHTYSHPRDQRAGEWYLCSLAYYRAWDCGNLRRAEMFAGHLLTLEGDLPTVHQAVSLAEAAFAIAAFCHDPVLARDRLERASARFAMISDDDKDRDIVRLNLLRAEAAILLAEGQTEPAHAQCEEWLSCERLVPARLPGLRLVEREWIEGARAERSMSLAGRPG
jgi:hypothetical protein